MLEVKHLHKKFGNKSVLNGISFTAERGEITVLIGVNGIGKTTIMNMMMGLIPIKKGEVSIDGQVIKGDRSKKLAYICDQIVVNKGETIFEAMAFMRTFYPNWNDEKVKKLLHFFKFKGNEVIQQLSKGNVAKVNLLLGLSLDVDFVLMDEPFSGIDIFSREQIVQLFTSDLLEGIGIILTSHEIEDIEYIVDKAILLDEGKVIKEFYAEQVREEEGKSIVDVMREVYQS